MTANELVRARAFGKIEFGLDISAISHLLLALVSWWASAAGKSEKLTKAIASHRDFDARHFRAVFDRLVVAAGTAAGGANDDLVIKVDGHVDFSSWREQYERPSGIGLEESARSRSYHRCQDQLSRAMIENVASVDQIARLIADLLHTVSIASTVLSEEDLLELERKVLACENSDENVYTQHLQDWIVSSDSFTGDGGDVEHFYQSNAKTSVSALLGKILLKDARRCWKDLPKPHPNASIFVCYSDERMDMCKAMIVGATATPYSGGLFVFDVCYPQLYPNAPPMLHFMLHDDRGRTGPIQPQPTLPMLQLTFFQPWNL